MARMDGTAITEFDGLAGPHEGTVFITSEPQSICAAHAAVDPQRSTHIITLLRRIDPASLPSAAPPAPPPEAVTAPAPVAEPSPPKSTPADEALKMYPWAHNIAIPDASFNPARSTNGGVEGIKAKYNIPQGTALAPLVPIQATAETSKRKEIFSSKAMFTSSGLR